ncbi:cutinase [Dendrothele bispora CBS 962.96]|uniref:cutinase n=1 Tax=Dendrothele bispora (strain CBS 962.96) TaxID=1314807 RepID=A0A4S8MXL4_DENBC|nr:cutinase [Dendrothele bispora CBS 962.96]
MHFALTSFVTLGLLASAFAAPALTERQNCADVIVIFARGTTEPAPIGTVVGPPLQAALQAQLGSRSLSFQGVDYPADIAGFFAGGDPLTSAANNCPNSKIVTVGYSQGGQLVHNSVNLLSSAVRSRISAAVIFGDPDFGSPVTGVPSTRTDIICHVGDDICAHGDLVLPPHLTYGADTPAAAAFIVSRI